MYVINKLCLTSKRNHAGRREVTSQNNDVVTTFRINVLNDGLNCYRQIRHKVIAASKYKHNVIKGKTQLIR